MGRRNNMSKKRVILLAAMITLTSSATVFLLNRGKTDWFDIIGTIIAFLAGVLIALKVEKKEKKQ